MVPGFTHGAPVVTSAAIIMMGVFGGFILGSDALIVLGFAFAVAVFFDAFVVRMTIVPAVLVLLRDRAWWLPRWLDPSAGCGCRGASSEHRLAEREREPAQAPATA